MSFDGSGVVVGVAFDDEDVLEFDPGSGSWAMAYDGDVQHPEWAPANLVALDAVEATLTPTPTATPTDIPTVTPTATVTATPTNAPLRPGDACTTNGQCQSGFCIGAADQMFCCDQACTRPGQTCDGPASKGTCFTPRAAPALSVTGILATILLLMLAGWWGIHGHAPRPPRR